MNHDVTHCFDYDPKSCPKRCDIAQVTEELRHIAYELPTSWAHFRGTKYCPMEVKK